MNQSIKKPVIDTIFENLLAVQFEI